MGRRKEPSARELLKAMGIDPLHELAERALECDRGSEERLNLMREMLPYVHSKLKAQDTVVKATARGRVFTVEIGGDE